MTLTEKLNPPQGLIPLKPEQSGSDLQWCNSSAARLDSSVFRDDIFHLFGHFAIDGHSALGGIAAAADG